MKLGFEFKRGFWYGPPMAQGDVTDYAVDFTELLEADVISTVDWQIANGTKTKVANTAGVATAWLSPNSTAEVVAKCTIVTIAGRTISRSFKVEVKP